MTLVLAQLGGFKAISPAWSSVDLAVIAASMVGLSVCLEHDDAMRVGAVKSSSRQAGRFLLLLDLRDGLVLERTKFLSLGYSTVRGRVFRVVHLALTARPARPECLLLEI